MNRNGTVEKGISDIVGVFTDPIITYPSPWNADIPQWLKEWITIERLAMNIKVSKGEEVTGTDAEALAYIMPASLEFPLDSDWTQIYLYIATKVCTAAGKETPSDIQIESLNDYQMTKLNRLKAWLYHRRIRARQENERSERRERKEAVAVRKAAEQPAIFEF